MQSGLTGVALGALAIAWLAAVAVVRGQAAPDRPLLAEDVFKNIQRTTVVRTSDGASTTTFDGRRGWLAAPSRPVAPTAGSRP